jgi:hypothetical protein
LEELRPMGNIVIYLYKRRKFRIIKVKRYWYEDKWNIRSQWSHDAITHESIAYHIGR